MGIWSIITSPQPISVCTIILEKDWCYFYSGKVTSRGNIKDLKQFESWSPAKHIEPNATRLFEEIVRKLKSSKRKFNTIIVSMPGTIKNNSDIITSSRLGINQPFQASTYISSAVSNVRVVIVQDINCMLFGAQNALAIAETMQHETTCYIVVDEGVGSAIMIDGKIHHGAGIAGHISRLVVEENGNFYQELAQSGSLESYVSRPWISQRCVECYEFSRNFRQIEISRKETKFEKALKTASSRNDKRRISYDLLSSGVKEENSIAINCLKDAAKYLGKAIGSIIAISHPHRVLLAGKLITDVEKFYDNAILSAQNHSWPAAWNSVAFEKRDNSRDDQVKGAFMLAMIENIGDVL